MDILIATPAFGGMVHADFALSLARSVGELTLRRIPHTVLCIGQESLINRARNHFARHLLQSGSDRLLFIDADLSWSPEQLLTILESDQLVVGGTYPLKSLPIRYNFNPLATDAAYFEDNDRSAASLERWGMTHANTRGEAAVQHVPTGFLMIRRTVFERLTSIAEPYQSLDPNTGKTMDYHNFFPVRVREGVLQSEDWGFCDLCREAGIPVMLNYKVRLPHIGTFTYSAS